MINKKNNIIPIPSSRKIERISENARAVDIVLKAEEIKMIDDLLDTIPMSKVFGEE